MIAMIIVNTINSPPTTVSVDGLPLYKMKCRQGTECRVLLAQREVVENL